MPQETDGQRVRRLRKRARLNQTDLAARVGRAQSWVSMVERGHIPLDSVSMVNTLARALAAHPNEITGKPYRGSSPSEERGHEAIPQIRRQVERYDLTPDWDRPVRSVDDLAAAVADISALGQAARYTRIAERAPDLLAELQAATETYTGHDRERAYALLADAYREIHAVCYGLGYEDLAALITRNIRWAAGRSGDPMLVTVADCLRVRDLWLSASWTDALTVIDRALASVEDEYRAGLPGAVAVTGALHRRAAITAARRYDAAAASDRLELARQAVNRHPAHEQRDYYKFTSTPLNVSIYGVAVAVELGDGTTAVSRGADLRIPAGVPAYKAGHHYMDLARGWLWHGSRDRALTAMEHAERIAPLLVRNHPMARAAVRSMLDQETRYNERLRQLADRMHVL